MKSEQTADPALFINKQCCLGTQDVQDCVHLVQLLLFKNGQHQMLQTEVGRTSAGRGRQICLLIGLALIPQIYDGASRCRG